MSTVTLEEAGRRLRELVETLPHEKEIIITDAGKPIATLIGTATVSAKQGSHSVLDIKPRSVGKFLRPFPHPDDDILGEMLDNKFDPNK